MQRNKVSIMVMGCSLLLFLFAVPSLTGASPQSAPQPLELIRSASERIYNILKQAPEGLSAEQRRQRRDSVVKIVYEFIDFREMSKRALGRNWKKEPEAKREAFVPLFEKLLYNTYIDRVDSYTSGKERIVYDGQKIDGNYAVVVGRIVGYKKNDIPIKYRLKRIDGKWKAYDVVIEGVSFINNYRSQFNSILAKNSFDQLLQRMRDKIADLEAKQE